MKQCSKCKEVKLKSEFGIQKRSHDGLQCYCRKCKLISAKEWRDNNKEKYRGLRKQYRKKHSASIADYRRKWYVDNRDWALEYNKAYQKGKSSTSIEFKLAKNLRARLYTAIKLGYKAGSAVKDLGCTIAEFKDYIASKFQAGMTWDNYGEWHIDHIKPLASFDLTNREEFLKACHYTNLQPLWASDNLRKGDSNPVLN